MRMASTSMFRRDSRTGPRCRGVLLVLGLVAGRLAVAAGPVTAQQGQDAPNPRRDSLRMAQRLDAEGDHEQARAIFRALIESAPDAAARAAARRRLGMSHGYTADCAGIWEQHEQIIAYWRSRRAEDPQNAHYQEGEMANEAARVCLDAGDFDEAERLYRHGTELGYREPEPRTHPKSLWDFRLSHAMARISARRGEPEEAQRWVAEARRALDSDPEMAEGQERYFPYLVGYVALYTDDLETAERELTKSVEGLRNDPFQVVLLGMTYEKVGRQGRATELYERAYEMSAGSNPPNVYARRFTREKLGKH